MLPIKIKLSKLQTLVKPKMCARAIHYQNVFTNIIT